MPDPIDSRATRASDPSPDAREAGTFSIIVPTLNEEPNILPLLERIERSLGPDARDAEVLFLDGASTDGTAEAVARYSGPLNARLILAAKPGLSNAILQGIREAGGKTVVVMDADLSHPAEAIPGLLQAVREGAQVAIGSRYIPGGRTEDWPWKRRMLSRLGALLARPLTRARDPLSGFFALDRELLSGEEFEVEGFKVLLEILVRCDVKNPREVPITFRDRQAGHSKLGFATMSHYLRQLHTLAQRANPPAWQLFKFGVAGGLGTIVHLGVITLLIEACNVPYLFAGGTAFVVAATHNYLWNRAWTWPGAPPRRGRFPMFLASSLAGLAVHLTILRILVGEAGLGYLPSSLIGIGCGFLLNFALSRLIFRSQ